jgi:hypothetical protein
MAEHLSRHGLNVTIARRPTSGSMAVPKDYFQAFDPENVNFVTSPWQTVRLARESRLIFSATAELLGQLRKIWRWRHLLGLPPVINLTTGSDLSELSVEDTLNGRRYRQYMDMAAVNWCLPIPHGLQNLLRLKAPRVVFMQGFPYVMPEAQRDVAYRKEPGEALRLFHCSHLDWNFTDFGERRNSTKGNHKFLRAFIRAVHDNVNVQLTILDRGADREIARNMIEESGVGAHVTWKPGLGRDDLYREAQRAHIAVNMFHHGGSGGISYEMLALGVPVMQYANPTYFRLMYGGAMPPFINCRTEDEIFEKIRWAATTQELPDIADAGRKWVAQHIVPESAMTGFLFYYSLLTGDKKIDCGPFVDEMRDHVRLVQEGRYDPLEGLRSAN